MRTITIDGRLGRDAEIKTTPSGVKYVRFSVANTSYVEGKDETIWFDVTSFDTHVIERQIEYLKKGKAVYVSGPLNVKVKSVNGNNYVNYYIRANSIELSNIGRKSDTDVASTTDKAQQFSTMASTAMTMTNMTNFSEPTPAPQTVSATYSASFGSDTDDEELPF